MPVSRRKKRLRVPSSVGRGTRGITRVEPGLLVANDDPRVHRRKGNEGKRRTTVARKEGWKRDCDNPKSRGEERNQYY